MSEPRDSAVLRPQRVRAQQVAGLVERIPAARLHGDPQVTVSGITHDSRQGRGGVPYLARGGGAPNGIPCPGAALPAGAVAVLPDPAWVQTAVAAGLEAVVGVDAPRPVTGPAAAWVYGD